MVGGVAHAVDAVRSGNCCRRTEIISPASRTGDGVPLPRQSRNRTGRHTGCERNGNSTTIPTMIHRLPRPSALGCCAEPSGGSSTRRTPAGPSGGTGCRRRPPRSARPRRAAWSRSAAPAPGRADRHSQACAEKNRQHAWNDTTAAMPAPGEHADHRAPAPHARPSRWPAARTTRTSTTGETRTTKRLQQNTPRSG